MHRYMRLLNLGLYGVICSFALAPYFFFPCLLTISILIYYIAIASRSIDAFYYGLSFGAGYFLGGLYWVVYALYVYIDTFWWAVPIALTFMPLCLGISFAIAGYITYRLRSYGVIIVFTLSLLFLDWLRSWIFTGFPWNYIGHCLCFSLEISQIASIFGVYGMSFIGVFLPSGAYFLFSREYKKFYIHVIISIVIITSAYLYGSNRLANNKTQYTNISVGIVQPSIEQVNKSRGDVVKRHLALCEGSKQDIIIWPEAVFGIYEGVKDRAYQYLANKINANFIIGVDRIEPISIYTSAIAVSKEGKELFVYDKKHLVPFGEYMPSFIPIKKLTEGILDYSKGGTEDVFSISGIKIRPLICYEAIFPIYEEVDLIVNIVNDAWYRTSPGPHQHFHIARLRAIETGTPIVRAANHGISAVVDGCGRIIKSTNLNEVTMMESQLPAKNIYGTLYSRYKNLLWMFILIIIAFINKYIKI